MANVVTDDRIGFNRAFDEWVRYMHGAPSMSGRTWTTPAMGLSKDLRPMFLDVPDDFLPVLRAKGVPFEVQA